MIGIWKFHVYNRAGRAEILSFLKLAKGCTRLLDLGASAGIFSALFAVSRPSSDIVSVEPDGLSFDLLGETIDANRKGDSPWRRERVAVGASTGAIRFVSTGFGGSVATDDGAGEEVRVETMRDLCARLDFKPDLVKIDVESFEDEILSVSLEWLQQMKPALFLELHWQFLVDRDKDPEALLERLRTIGLKMNDGRSIPAVSKRHLDRDGCTRLALNWAK
ncbi:MAG: FkbM family methyltransferase [Rhodospirillales bacterium]|nr:FkbM family methyltransferase [Acetobacter sp.]